MDAQDWDRRYAGTDLVWGAAANRWIEVECAGLPPGRALDLACGEGRNALWLADRGWRVTAVDFSQVGLDRGAALVAQRAEQGEPLAGSVTWVRADLLHHTPAPGEYDLVVLAYLQLPAEARRVVVREAVQALAPGGRLVVVAHDTANLDGGHGGPQDPHVLYTAADLEADVDGIEGLHGVTLEVLRAEPVRRPVETADGPREAIDALFVARRAEAAA